MFASYRTTIIAVLGAITVLSHQAMAVLDNDPTTVFNLDAVFQALAILGIGIFARDNAVSSKSAGAK